MRESFIRELELLEADVLRMGGYVVESVGQATTALAEGDTRLADAVIEADAQIDQIYLHVETKCYELLAQQQPVAGDLRLILSMLRVIQDLERSGDLTKNVAGIVSADINIVKLKPVAELIGKLGLTARDLLGTAIDAFAEKDLTKADALAAKDDKVDNLYRDLVKELFRLDKESSLEIAMNMVLTGRFFERIADHAVNIGVWVKYMETGVLPG
jgi:phosphate transport system protein